MPAGQFGASASRSSRSAANQGRACSGCSASGGIVISPRKRTLPERATSLQEPVRLSGARPPWFLAGDVHLQQAVHRLSCGRDSIWAHTDSESTAWIRRTRPDHVAHLAALDDGR